MTNKREIKFIVFWSLFVSILALLPLAYGYLNAPHGKVYTGLTASIYFSDVNSYFSWIRQAQEGSFLFEDKFTSEPHHAWIFHPVFLGIGLLSRLSRINVIYFWYLAIIASNFFLLYVIYLFVWNFFSPEKSITSQTENSNAKNEKRDTNQELTLLRVLSFVIITISSGFGWLLGQISADSWLIELSTFQSMRWPFIFSIAISLILLIFLFLLKSEETGKMKFIAYAGLGALLLSIIHPYDMFVVVPVAVVFLLITGSVKKEFKKALRKIFLFLVLISPGILYNFFITLFDPVFGLHNKISMPSPSPLSYMLGFGLLSVFGAIGIIFTVLGAYKTDNGRKYNLLFLLAWFITGFCMLYAPVNFQNKFALGLQIPLAIFSTIALMEITKKLNEKYKLLAISVIISFLSIGSFMFLLNDMTYLSEKSFPFYVDKDFLAGLEWLDKNTKNQDIILSSYNSGNFIPRFSGNRVFIGHWAQTINITDKEEAVKKFYSKNTSEEDMKIFIEENHISYVLCGDFEYDCKNKEWEKNFIASGNIELVFNNQNVKIYKVTSHN